MRKFLLCSLLLLLPVACLLQAQTIKISVQKGQQYKVETFAQMINSMDSSQTTIPKNMIEGILDFFLETTTTDIVRVIRLSKNEIELESTRTRITSRTKMMGKETISDTDKKEGNDTITRKSEKIIIDYNGIIIKSEKPEKIKGFASENAWMFSGSDEKTDLFVPEFIGKEIKEGYSFPVAASFSKEKPSTSFSLNKETVSIADTGTYTIDSVRNGIASISYTGIQAITMQMKMGTELITTISKSIGRSNFRVDINSGIVISRTTTEESVAKPGDNDPANTQSYKSTTTKKITLLE